MTPKLHKDLCEAVERESAMPLKVQGDANDKTYVIVEESALPTLWDDFLRKEVDRGLAAIDRGEVESWDIEATITEAALSESRRAIEEGLADVEASRTRPFRNVLDELGADRK